MPNINIDDAYILNETGAQVDKVTGLYFKDESTSAAEKAFAQLNIGTAGSNRNLLDNPFFTVNQRGKSSYNSAGYSVDRWLSNGTQQVTVSSDGVTLGEQGYRFVQRMENPAIFAGKTLTISAKTSAANVRFAYWDSTSDYNNGSAVTVPVVDGYASLTINITNGIYAIGLSTASGTGGLYRAIKLELGSVSTLANDAPPEYETELLKCQYYAAPLEYTTYSNPFTGLAASATEFFVEAYLPRSMREISNPTISVTGTAYAIRNGSTGAITTWDAGAIKGNHIRLKGTTTNLTANTQVPVYTAGNTLKIFVSADL